MADNNRTLEMLGKVLFSSLLLLVFSIIEAGVLVADAIGLKEGQQTVGGGLVVIGLYFFIWGMTVLFHLWKASRSTSP